MQRASVPCGSCHACCRGDAIILHPECGDDPAIYRTVEDIHPLTGLPCKMLAKKPNGDCIHLGDSGCTIHGHAPAICREFDCRRMYLKMPRAERKALIRAGLLDKAVFDAGRARVDTLPERAA